MITPSCPTCPNPHDPAIQCRFAVSLMEQLSESVQHEKDADCTVDPETLICTVCLVDHSDPCPDCKGRGFHELNCYWMSPALLIEA